MENSREEIQAIKLDVGLIKKDITVAERQCTQVSAKVSESIEKLQEVNANIVKMITIHEQKHEQHDKVEGDLKVDIKELHSRITTVNREFHDKMEHIEQHITKKIDDLRTALLESAKQQPDQPDEKKNIISSLAEFDKWKWMILGAALVVGWILGHVNIHDLLLLIK